VRLENLFSSKCRKYTGEPTAARLADSARRGHRSSDLPRLVGAVTLIVAAACSDKEPSEPPLDRRPPALSSAVTGAAAASLKDGEFQFASAPTPSSIPQITGPQAEAVALAWRAPFGTARKDYLTQEHGAAVEPEQLSVCGRTYYATSAFEPPPASVASNPLKLATARAFGPWWIVHLCAPDGIPAVVVAVSAYDFDVTIENGSLVLPARGGNWFLAQAVPPRTKDWPMAPEEAVSRAAGWAQRRITKVPTLVAPPFIKGRPQDARWLLNLERPVAGLASDDTTVYAWQQAGRMGVHLGVAAASQPDEMTGYYLVRPPGPGRTLTRDDFAPLTFRRRTGVALDVSDV